MPMTAQVIVSQSLLVFIIQSAVINLIIYAVSMCFSLWFSVCALVVNFLKVWTILFIMFKRGSLS